MSDSASASIIYPADGLSPEVAYEALDVPYFKAEDDQLAFEEATIKTATPPNEMTTKRELLAWWLYYFAYEPVSVVAMVLLIPLLLQSLARQGGHLLGEIGKACPEHDDSNSICIAFSLFGGAVNITPSAFAYYVISASVAAQAVTFVSVGALADYGRMRKILLAICTWLGVACSMGMLAVRGSRWIWLAAVLNIFLSVFYGTASVFYNAYLPLLVQNHPKLAAFAAETESNRYIKKREKLSSFISTVGMAAGYFAGIIMICAMIAYFSLVGSDGLALQVGIAACGFWWLLWSFFPLAALQYRPGAAFPEGTTNFLTFSWKKLFNTLRRARQLPTTFAFLLCYFFFSDGYNTMGSAAILIAKQSLDVGLTQLTICALIAPICALIGTFFCFFLQRLLKASNKVMLMGLLVVMGGIPVYCALGLFTSRFGLRKQWEIYAITSIYGFIIGAVQSFSRVLFSDLIPAGEESEFFSLYAVTDKGSAFLGPMVVALLSDWTNEPRYGLLFLAALILVPVPFIGKFVKRTSKKSTNK